MSPAWKLTTTRSAPRAQARDVAIEVGLGGHGDAGVVGAREEIEVDVEQELALAVGEQAHAQAADVDDDAAARLGGVAAGADGGEAGAGGVGQGVGEAVAAVVERVVVGERRTSKPASASARAEAAGAR